MSSGTPGEAVPPAWVGDVVAAVNAELGAKPPSHSTTRFGPAKRSPTGGSALHALFEVDLREHGLAVDVDQSRELRLRRPDGSGDEFPVQAVIANEPERLVVQASAQAQEPLEMVADSDPRFILTSLSGQLAALSNPGLAVGLAHGRAGGEPAGKGSPQAFPRPGIRLNDAQFAAFNAALAPGLHMVWGPPGTGKTQVLAAVLAHVTAVGGSALLVSGTNVAVDQALLKAAQATSPQPGQLIRVGTPTLHEVASHSFLPLDQACRWKAANERRRMDQLGRRRAELLDAPVLQALDRARLQLDAQPFDEVAYRGAKERLEHARSLTSLRRRNEEQLHRLREARQARLAAVAELGSADVLAAEVAKAADAYRRVDQLREEIARVDDDLLLARGRLDQAAAALTTTNRALVAHTEAPLHQRLSRRGDLRQMKARRREQLADLAQARDAVVRNEEALTRLRERAHERVPELQAQAAPFSREAVQSRLESQSRARELVDETVQLERGCDEAATTLTRELERAEHLSLPEEGDAELVRVADALGLALLPGRIAALEQEAAPLLEELGRLDDEEAQLQGRVASMAGTVVQEASVVATTLAQLVLNRSVGARQYDYVFVDEASFALPPFVVLAASRATHGVTLFGDFLQNGPISRCAGTPEFDHLPSAVRRWLELDCFALLGLDDASKAQQVRGCIALREQHRFGPTINDLANRVAYGGLLKPAGDRDVEPDEVVFVDVAGFADRPQRDVRSGKGRTWMAGALIARALAVSHGRAGEEVGIVVPYAAQQRLTTSLVLDAGLGPNVSIGTSHKFQGREFPVVIFDLVEFTPTPGSPPGWVARGRLHGSRWELDGLRLFNVALTRARRRMYLIADGGAIDAAREGPLAEVRAMIGNRQVRVVPVRELLDSEPAPRPAPDLPTTASGQDADVEVVVREAFASYRLLDEKDVYEQLDDLLGTPKGSVWIWSPFVARRADEVLPYLERHAGAGGPVTVFVKPPLERHGCPEETLQRLRRAGIRAVGIHRMHQKIVVLDERRTLLGSLNLLSHARQRPTIELMLLVDGERFARELLQQQLAERFGRCPRCRDHPDAWCYADRKPRTSSDRWIWRCPVPGCERIASFH
jgi:hypothetical protein